MKYAIYGAGAMGTVLGAYIARAGIPVDLINRNERHVAALKERGAHIVGTVDFVQKVNALLPSEMKEQYDVILLMTKQRQNAEIAAFLKDYLKEDGALCTCQNGLPEPKLADILGADRVLGCAIAWGATFRGEGVSELTSDPAALTFSLGAYGKGNRLDEVCTLLECMGTVTVEENFIGARWSKLLINSAFSGLSTVTGETFGTVSKNKKSRAAALSIIKECIDVAKAAGIRPEPGAGAPHRQDVRLQGRDEKEDRLYAHPDRHEKARAADLEHAAGSARGEEVRDRLHQRRRVRVRRALRRVHALQRAHRFPRARDRGGEAENFF